MLDHPGIVIAEPVSGFELRQSILIESELVALSPWARQLQLVEDAEFHDVSPKACRQTLLVCCASIVMAADALSIAGQFRAAEGPDTPAAAAYRFPPN